MAHKIKNLSQLVRIYRVPPDKRTNNSERGEHISAVSWFDHTYPHLKKSLIHIPNETQSGIPNERNSGISHQLTLNKMGRRAGAPDLILAHKTQAYPYAMIEMKAHRGSVSSAQKEMLNHHVEAGAFCAVCFGFDAFKMAVIEYVES